MSAYASVDQVQTQYFTFAEDEPFLMSSGASLSPVTLAYQTYGDLNAERSNAILICHALSGSQQAAGTSATDPGELGWWYECIGPGKAFDTEKYFVICSNVIGGCFGSSGPTTLDPKTGKPYGLTFPVVTIADMVEAQVQINQPPGHKSTTEHWRGFNGGDAGLAMDLQIPGKGAFCDSHSYNSSTQSFANRL